jgi:trehalose/maltose hydrolase-like predicted phosphorylase
MTEWRFVVDGFEPEAEGWREALLTLANGYQACRGAAPESGADGVHYPGTYLAGCYNRLESRIDGNTVQNEDLVNVPNWLPLRFRIGGGDWFDAASADLLDYRQVLDIRGALLTRRMRIRDAGRVLTVTQRRLVCMADPHLASLQTTFEAEGWDGRLTVQAALDGLVANTGVARYRDLEKRHLVPLSEGNDGNLLWLQVETITSKIRIAEAATVTVDGREPSLSVDRRRGWVAAEFDVELTSGHPRTVEKTVAIFTSRDSAIEECLLAARDHALRAGTFDDLERRHRRAWRRLWSACRIKVGGESQLILNLHLFHIFQTISEHTVELDVAIPARGLHGEAYRGHIFWDELFVLPLIYLRLPHVARNLLLYRWRRLPAARSAAREAGYRGAMYPWQSGSDGREETQRWHLNPRSGHWFPDHSQHQRHVGSAIAYNVWKYYEATGDLEFLNQYGAEMLVEIARFWGSIAVYDEEDGRYDIRGVMGPDEYHDAYPDRAEPGIDNNAYTNVMAAWTIGRALDTLDLLPECRRIELCELLDLADAEIAHLRSVSTSLRVAFTPDGVIDQFEGYHRLAELDWDKYRQEYGDIHRMDRILESEGDTANRYQVSKQADVLMLWFLFGEEEVLSMLAGLGYEVDAGVLTRTLHYYLDRTSHGSTLSAVVHAWILARADHGTAWQFFKRALASDIEDIQGGTTAEGIHLGAMAGTVDLVQRRYTGLEIRDGVLHLNPTLPPELPELEMRMHFRGHEGMTVRCTHERVQVSLLRSGAPPIEVAVGDRRRTLRDGETWDVSIEAGPAEPVSAPSALRSASPTGG